MVSEGDQASSHGLTTPIKEDTSDLNPTEPMQSV